MSSMRFEGLVSLHVVDAAVMNARHLPCAAPTRPQVGAVAQSEESHTEAQGAEGRVQPESFASKPASGVVRVPGTA